MAAKGTHKPIGGVESVALYSADAVQSALFSRDGCEVELSGLPIKVPLLEDASKYEECSRLESGVTSISHLLHIVAERNNAGEWLNPDFIEQATFEGFIAVISLCDGRQLLAGYSAQFGEEHLLRLENIISTSGTELCEMPTVTLRLVSHDTEFSPQIL